MKKESQSLKTKRVTVKRRPDRGIYDFDEIANVLDAGFLCHAGFVIDGQPVVLPTCYGRDGDYLIIHGSAASRMLRDVSKGIPVCVTITHFDGIVLARTAFNHSINYRSVVILGTAELLEGDEKMAALANLTDHMLPGRWDVVRQPTKQETKATTALRIKIEEASLKVRKGPPLDDEEDMGHECWAGVIPVDMVCGEPVVDPRSPKELPQPDYVRNFWQEREKALGYRTV